MDGLALNQSFGNFLDREVGIRVVLDGFRLREQGVDVHISVSICVVTGVLTRPTVILGMSQKSTVSNRNQVRPRILSSCCVVKRMTTAKRNLKEQVLALYQEGKTLQQIRQQLACSLSTVAYHLYPKTKTTTKKRVYKKRKLEGRFDYRTQNGIIYGKYYQFFRIGKTNKHLLSRQFPFQDLLRYLPEQPSCYLTGDILSYSDSKSYSFDHKTPSSRGGLNTLENLGIASAVANRAKSDMTEAEFVVFCKRVLIHHGYLLSCPPTGVTV